MTRLHRRLALMLAASVLLTSACAVAPAKPEIYGEAIRSVGIVSALPADAHAVRIGLTIFNNSQRAIPMAGEPGAIALAELESRLRKARPQWTVKRIDAASTPTPATSAQLGALAKAAGVDAVVAVVETRHHNGGGQGVGVYVSALPGLKPVVFTHSAVSVQVVDKAGQRLAEATSFSQGYKVPETGFIGDLNELDLPQTLDRVKDALRGALRFSIDDAMTRLGY